MKKVLLLINITILIGCSGRSLLKSMAKTPEYEESFYQNDTTYNKYQKDFIYLDNVLKKTHPNMYNSYDSSYFVNKKNEVLSALKNVKNDIDFQFLIQQYVAKIKDSHTKVIMGYPNEKELIPFKYLWIKDKLYIESISAKEDTSFLGARIKSINNITLNKVVKSFSDFISVENDVWLRRNLTYLLRSPYFLYHAGIVDTSENSVLFKLQLLSGTDTTISVTYENNDDIKWTILAHSSYFTKPGKEFFKYTLFPEKDYAYFQFNKMIDYTVASSYIGKMNFFIRPFAHIALFFYGMDHLDEVLDKMFREIANKNINNLIVDLRYNTGGNSILGRQFLYYCDVPKDIREYGVSIKFSNLYQLQYPEDFEWFNNKYKEKYAGHTLPFKLLDFSVFEDSITSRSHFFDQIEDPESDYFIEKPAVKFKGNLYFLIGPNTYSSGSMFATIVKDNNIGLLVGEPTGQKPTSYGDILYLKLPQTETICTISYKEFYRPDTSKNETPSLLPDKEVYPTIEDYINGRDPVLEYVEKKLGVTN